MVKKKKSCAKREEKHSERHVDMVSPQDKKGQNHALELEGKEGEKKWEERCRTWTKSRGHRNTLSGKRLDGRSALH